ncbi:hypothetical protein C8R43DRAFT_957763 [Mycena crocata]|nr:hypothetical protein C8R43DRAFT_957763 [Mycena crocata]
MWWLECVLHTLHILNPKDRPSVDETLCYDTRENFTVASDARNRAPARDRLPMAVYYDDYGDYGFAPGAFYPDVNDTHPYYEGSAYDVAPAGYDEPHDEYAHDEFEPTLYEEEPYASDSAYYEEVEADDGLMEIECGQPGYWEEYQRRRYEIIHGTDSAEVEYPDASGDDAELVLDGTVQGDRRYTELDVDAVEQYSVDAAAVTSGDDDGKSSWMAVWDLGPPIGENEVAWAEAMDVWRQRIASRVTEHSYEPDCAEESVTYAPPPAACVVDHVVELGVAEQPPMEDALLSLEELQAAYDRGEIPDEDREECARMLGELWACELEDQCLLAAGHVWNDELGEYMHPDGSDLSEEYEVEEDDVMLNEHADVYSASDVPDLPLVALSGINAPSFPSQHAPPLKSSDSKHQFAPRRHFSRAPKLKFRPDPAHGQRIHTLMPKRRPSTRASEAAGTMVPAPSATPPPVADDSRCSLATVPIVAADIRHAKDPVPPDKQTSSIATHAAAVKLVPDAILIPRLPKPPNICAARTTVSSVSPSVPVRISVPDSVLRVAVPKPPKILAPAAAQVAAHNSSAQHCLNAQRRIAKKGKG